MNWKLILTLSLFGLAMALATVSLIPNNIEPIFWLIIFSTCAYILAKRKVAKPFLHGFLISIVNSIWITAVHIIMYDSYTANHPEMLKMGKEMPMADNLRLGMVLMGPFFGIVFGVIQGLFALGADKLFNKKSTA